LSIRDKLEENVISIVLGTGGVLFLIMGLFNLYHFMSSITAVSLSLPALPSWMSPTAFYGFPAYWFGLIALIAGLFMTLTKSETISRKIVLIWIISGALLLILEIWRSYNYWYYWWW
jgi:hypothetical protein